MNLYARYYDHPDGNDASGKMLATNRYAIGAGLAMSTFDVLLYSKPKGTAQILGRYGYYLGPFVGMASAFTMTTYAMTNLRGKDDKLNYVLGGLAAGGVYGAWMRSGVAVFVSGLIFAAAAACKKDFVEKGWEFFPTNRQHIKGDGDFRTLRRDWTLLKDPGREESTPVFWKYKNA